MDGPNDEGRKQVHKWTDLTKGQDYSPQYGQIQEQGSLNKSTKWTDPTKGNTQVHNMDEFHEGSRSKSIKWTDPMNYQKSCPQSRQTTKGQNSSP